MKKKFSSSSSTSSLYFQAQYFQPAPSNSIGSMKKGYNTRSKDPKPKSNVRESNVRAKADVPTSANTPATRRPSFRTFPHVPLSLYFNSNHIICFFR